MKKIFIILIVTGLIILTLVLILKRFNVVKFSNKMDRRLKYFNTNEFDSPAMAGDEGEKYTKRGKQYLRDSGVENMNFQNLKMFDTARAIVQREWNEANPLKEIVFSINSGYRTQQFNDSLSGSVKNSSHIKGKAADIDLSKYDTEQREVVLNALRRAGFNRFGLGVNFVHVDSDSSKKQNWAWDYGTGSMTLDPFTV